MAFRSTILAAIAATLLALHAWTAWTSTLRQGPAFDETAHLAAGHSYWAFNDYRLQPENGNLPQRWAGLGARAVSPRMEADRRDPDWMTSNVWMIGQRFLYESGNPPEPLLASARAAMTLWGVGCGLLVFFWSRRLWGDVGGLLSLALCVASPTLLAHGPLVTSDTAAAFCLLAATGAFWRHLERPGAWSLALSLALTGLAAIAKFSVLLLPAIYGLLLAWHFFSRPTPPARIGARAAGLVAAHVAAALFVVWAAFGFRYSAAAPGMPRLVQLYIPWEYLVPGSGAKGAVLSALKNYRLLPEAYTHGLAYVLQASEARGAFAAGHLGATGWWWFFPYAFLLKSSFAELAAVLACGAVAVAYLKRGGATGPRVLLRSLAPFAPLLVFVGVYGAAAITSHLNIGHRHILPLYLPLFILAGALLRPAAGRLARVCGVALIAFQSVEAARAYPSYLTYFNALAGPADQRWQHLVDSSLDWGQELPALGDWLREHRQPKEPIYLSYFGVGDPRHEGIEGKPFATYGILWTAPMLEHLRPGLYCVSATILQDVYSPFNGAWTQPKENTFALLSHMVAEDPSLWGGPVLKDGTPAENLRWRYERARFARLAQYLRVRRPEAVVGRSILVYRLDAREVSLAIDLPPTEIGDLLESALRARGALTEGP